MEYIASLWLDMAIHYSNDLFIDYFTSRKKEYENERAFRNRRKPPPPSSPPPATKTRNDVTKKEEEEEEKKAEYKEDRKEKEENYFVELKSISQALLTLNERYITKSINNEIDSKLKDEFFKIVFCNSKFFHNPNYIYSYKSHYIHVNISTIKGENGIYLFHEISKNYQMRNALSAIINNFVLNESNNDNNNNNNNNDSNKNNINNILLLSDSNNKIAIECLVFGHYNEMYQNLKYKKNITQYQIELTNMLHFIQYKTISTKFSNII